MKKAILVLGAVLLVGLVCLLAQFGILRLPWSVPPSTSPNYGLGGYSGPEDLEFQFSAPVRAQEPAAPNLWVRRFRDEVLVFGREAGSSVDLKEVAGRLDANGVLRAKPRGDDAPRNSVEIVTDREIAYPGDPIQICVRATGAATAAPPARLHFEPTDQGIGPEEFRPRGTGGPGGDAPPGPRWQILYAAIPDDVRMGKAVVVCGSQRREIPIAPRFGPGAGKDNGPRAGSPEVPPMPGLELACRDGAWSAKAPPETTVILFYAECEGLLLAHEGVLALDGAASVTLPLGDPPPAGTRVTAVAATPTGFLEATCDVAGATGIPTKDPVLARFLSMRPRPGPPLPEVEDREGDEHSGRFATPSVASLEMPIGKAATLFADGRQAVPGSDVRWSVHPVGAEGALRIRAADGVLLETRVDRERTSGTLSARDIGDRTLLVESDAPGLKTVRFCWEPAPPKGPPEPVPARAGRVLSVESHLPSKGRVGDEVEYHIVIHLDVPGAVSVDCPIPAAAAPAEEGWLVRARSPVGTRVRLDWTQAGFEVPTTGPGDVVLSLRLRLARAGRFTVPPVTATGRDMAAGGIHVSANTASAVLVVE